MQFEVYAWSSDGEPHRLVHPAGVGSAHGRSPEQAADAIVETMRRQPRGRRALRLFNIEHPNRRAEMFNLDDLPRAVVEGPRTDGARDWCLGCFARLRRLGLRPDRIILDVEGGHSPWRFFQSRGSRVRAMREILASPAARAALPPEAQDVPAEAYRPGGAREAIQAMMDWAAQRMHEALREAVVAPAADVWGEAPPTSNYNDIEPAFDLFDPNVWRLPPGSVDGWSSPSCYLYRNGPRYARREHEPRWNRFVDCCNFVRSCLTGPGEGLAAWISLPHFNGPNRPWDGDPWLWGEFLRHGAAAGARTWLLWNPSSIAPDNATWTRHTDAAFMHLSQLDLQPPPPEALTPIELDVDEVRTGETVTTYAEFLQRLGE